MIDDEDYLNAEFAFYNEDAELVRVKVEDALNTSNLGYVYEEVENVWMKAVPVRRSEGEATLTANDSVCVEGEAILAPCSVLTDRDAEKVEKGLVGEYLEFRMGYELIQETHIDIYINLPSANAHTDSGCEEYFTYHTIPPAYLFGIVSNERTSVTYRSPDVSERLEALNLTEAASLVFTIVPRVLNTSIAPISIYEPSLVYTSLQEKAFV